MAGTTLKLTVLHTATRSRMTAPRLQFPLLLAFIAAGLAAVALFAPLSSASEKATSIDKPVAVVVAAPSSLAAMVAEQDAAARRALEASRQLTASKEAVTASASMPAKVSDGELLRSTDAPKSRTLRMLVTAYCPCTKCCGPNAQGITASGKPVSYNQGRFVAADKKVLPFGTKLIIPGYHDHVAVEVTDTGSAIKGNRLDVYYASHQQALEWGKQWLDVVVMD